VRKKILELVQTNPNLPPPLEIIFWLEKLMDNPDCEFKGFYRLIKTDAVLPGRLITLNNSALFGTGRNMTQNLKTLWCGWEYNSLWV